MNDSDYVCMSWFERDRAHVGLGMPDGKMIFDLWDEDVFEAIEDGFLTAPRFMQRARDSEWQPHAVAYARERGLIK